MKQFDRADAERLVQTYSDLILRLAYTYLKSTHDAEDICQNIFLKLLTGGQTFDSPAHEKAWIIRATANACKDSLRAAHRRNVGLEAAAATSGLSALLRGLFRARNRVSARSERVCRFRTPEPRAQKPAHHLGRGSL